MTSLTSYIQSQENAIGAIADSIQALQQQLTELQQQLRIQEQILAARRTAESEVSQWKVKTEKLLKDLCSVFPKEAFNDLKTEFCSMIDSIAGQHDDYAMSDRFLNGSEDEPIINKPEELTLTAIVEPAPSDPILDIIKSEPDDVISELKSDYGINGKVRTRKSIADKLTQMGISPEDVTEAIADIKASIDRRRRRGLLPPQSAA